MGSINKMTGTATSRAVQPGWDLDRDGPSDGLSEEDIKALRQRMPDGPNRRDFKTGAYRRQFGRTRNGEL